MTVSIDVVIVNWNGGELVVNAASAAVSSLKKLKVEGRVLVIDNGSTDNSVAYLKAVPSLNVFVASRNLGFAGACNFGARNSFADFILFLNPDTIITPVNLETCLSFMSDPANHRYAVCSLQLRGSDGRIARTCARSPKFHHLFATACGLSHLLPSLPLSITLREWDHASDADVDHVIGAFYMIRRRVFEEMNGFDERFFVYLEDLDLSLRIRRAGYRIRYLTAAPMFHMGGGTSDGIKAERLLLSLQSRLEFISRYSRPGAAPVLKIMTYTIEPLARILGAVVRCDVGAIRQTVRAYRWLWTGVRGEELMNRRPVQ